MVLQSVGNPKGIILHWMFYWLPIVMRVHILVSTRLRWNVSSLAIIQIPISSFGCLDVLESSDLVSHKSRHELFLRDYTCRRKFRRRMLTHAPVTRR